MRLWLSKNSPVPLREQLATQIMLGVISEDLKPGQRLPSIRELARRYRIHSNTVSAAYLDLVRRGWLERRRGSGMYVPKRRAPASSDASFELDELIARFFEDTRARGFGTPEVRSRIGQWLRQPVAGRLVLMDPEPELCEILAAEIQEGAGIAATAMPFEKTKLNQLRGCAVAALTSRAKQLHEMLPAAVPVILLRLRSVPESLEGQERPAPNALVTVVSQSPEILRWSRTILLAAALDADALEFRDAREPGWQDGLHLSAFLITDVVTARRIPAGCRTRVFRVVADSSIAELRTFSELAAGEST